MLHVREDCTSYTRCAARASSSNSRKFVTTLISTSLSYQQVCTHSPPLVFIVYYNAVNMPTRVVLDESPSAIHRESPRGDSRAQAAHFRSTLLRPVIESNIRGESNAIYTSATDIRASPRLAGYLYVLIASVVMVASIAQFYRNEEFGDDPIKNPWINPGSEFIIVGGARVFYWKFVGAFVVAVIGTITSFLIIVAHFDTFFFPRFWRRVFKDGSKI